MEGKEKKKKKILLGTKIQSNGDKAKSILDYVDETTKPISNNQGLIGNHSIIFNNNNNNKKTLQLELRVSFCMHRNHM